MLGLEERNARESLRARLVGRRAELARLGALVQGDRLIDEILADLDAIQREAFLAMDHLARQFGTPQRMAAAVVTQLADRDPSAEDWWWFYTAEVGAPRRSVAGL